MKAVCGLLQASGEYIVGHPHWPPVMGAPTGRIRPLMLADGPQSWPLPGLQPHTDRTKDNPQHLVQSYSNKARPSGSQLPFHFASVHRVVMPPLVAVIRWSGLRAVHCRSEVMV